VVRTDSIRDQPVLEMLSQMFAQQVLFAQQHALGEGGGGLEGEGGGAGQSFEKGNDFENMKDGQKDGGRKGCDTGGEGGLQRSLSSEVSVTFPFTPGEDFQKAYCCSI